MQTNKSLSWMNDDKYEKNLIFLNYNKYYFDLLFRVARVLQIEIYLDNFLIFISIFLVLLLIFSCLFSLFLWYKCFLFNRIDFCLWLSSNHRFIFLFFMSIYFILYCFQLLSLTIQIFIKPAKIFTFLSAFFQIEILSSLEWYALGCIFALQLLKNWIFIQSLFHTISFDNALNHWIVEASMNKDGLKEILRKSK